MSDAELRDLVAELVLLALELVAVSTSGVRSWVVYRTRGPSRRELGGDEEAEARGARTRA